MKHVQTEFKPGFELEVRAPYSLNYLIFIQNLYLNNSRENEKPLFPYMGRLKWGFLEAGFEETLAYVWKEALDKHNRSEFYDHGGVYEIDQAIYQKLFEDNEAGANGFSESIKSFLAWWDGIYGKIAIEKVFDNDSLEKVYTELSAAVKINKRLKINLIYDRLILSGPYEHSWSAVLPIEDVFNSSKRPEVISALLKCCEGN